MNALMAMNTAGTINSPQRPAKSITFLWEPSTDAARQLLLQKWLSTLGSRPARFQTRPPACDRAPWRLPGPDLHRLATTSF